MKPLLWKEFREVRFQFILWALVFLFLVGSHLVQPFQAMYAHSASMLIPFGAALVAIMMGVSNLIQERRTRTLDFLLTRPASANQIIWAKFLAGSAVVLYIVGLFAVFIYIQNKDWLFESVLAPPILEAGVPKLLAVLLPPFWFLYALTFLISVLVDESAKAFVGAGAFFIALLVAGVALSTDPTVPAGRPLVPSLATDRRVDPGCQEWLLVDRSRRHMVRARHPGRRPGGEDSGPAQGTQEQLARNCSLRGPLVRAPHRRAKMGAGALRHRVPCRRLRTQ